MIATPGFHSGCTHIRGANDVNPLLTPKRGLDLKQCCYVYRFSGMIRGTTVTAALILICLTIPSIAQTNQYLSHADSDPAALDLLDKLKAYLQKDRLTVDFGMSITHPAEEAIVTKGQYFQQGKKFRINTEDLQMWCDGNSRWVYMKNANEVNLYSAHDDDDIVNPVTVFTQYTSDAFISVITGSDHVREIPVQVIEIKPVDRDSEIAKLRLFVKSDGRPVRLEIMEKMALRTALDVYEIATATKQEDAFFTFNKNEFPGVHIEDLRID